MQPAFRKFAAQYRRVQQSEQLLMRLTKAQAQLCPITSAVSGELLRSSVEAATTVAQSLDLALAVLDQERRALHEACRAAMARHGIPL